MPFYEYRCKDYDLQFEQLVSISQADEKQICPHCGSKNTEKMLSLFSAKASSSAGIFGGGFT